MPNYHDQTKRDLEKMLKHETCGNILEALADIFADGRTEAADVEDLPCEREFRLAEGALRTLAFGLDAVVVN